MAVEPNGSHADGSEALSDDDAARVAGGITSEPPEPGKGSIVMSEPPDPGFGAISTAEPPDPGRTLFKSR